MTVSFRNKYAIFGNMLILLTQDVEVAGLLEEIHEHGLNGLGFVENSLSTDFQTTNILRVDIVLLEQVLDN